MEKIFILNPAINNLVIQDAVEERINKMKGVLNCLIFSLEFTQEDQELDSTSAYHALWAIDGFLDEINCLRQKWIDIQN